MDPQRLASLAEKPHPPTVGELGKGPILILSFDDFEFSDPDLGMRIIDMERVRTMVAEGLAAGPVPVVCLPDGVELAVLHLDRPEE